MYKTNISSQDPESRRHNIKTKIEQKFGELQQKYSENDSQFQSMQRNILLLGRAKSGKTTLKNILIDPRHRPEAISLCSSTVKQLTFDHPYDIDNLKLNIVNVPSRMIDESSDLNQINEACVDSKNAEFHLICFCVSINTGINEQDIELFKRLVEHFGTEKIRPNLCLIVTRSESQDDEWRANIRNELRDDVHFNYVIKQLGRGVYFSGALNPQDWHRANEESLLYQFQTIYEYRRLLLQLIMEDIAPFVVQTNEQALKNTYQLESTDNLEIHNLPIQSIETVNLKSDSNTDIIDSENNVHENTDFISPSMETSNSIGPVADDTNKDVCNTNIKTDTFESGTNVNHTSVSKFPHDPEEQNNACRSTESKTSKSERQGGKLRQILIFSLFSIGMLVLIYKIVVPLLMTQHSIKEPDPSPIPTINAPNNTNDGQTSHDKSSSNASCEAREPVYSADYSNDIQTCSDKTSDSDVIIPIEQTTNENESIPRTNWIKRIYSWLCSSIQFIKGRFLSFVRLFLWNRN